MIVIILGIQFLIANVVKSDIAFYILASLVAMISCSLYYYAYAKIKIKDFKFTDSKLEPLCRLIIKREDLKEKKILGVEMDNCWYVKNEATKNAS